MLRNLYRHNIFYSVSTKNGMEVKCMTFCCATCNYYSFIPMQNDLRSLASGLRAAKFPQDFPKTLIFCLTKVMTSKIYIYLSCYQKNRIGMYHASLTKETRQHTYRLYFGMVCKSITMSCCVQVYECACFAIILY